MKIRLRVAQAALLQSVFVAAQDGDADGHRHFDEDIPLRRRQANFLHLALRPSFNIWL